MDLSAFFPPGTPIGVLPTPGRPRLYFPSRTPTERWKYTEFYPAFKPIAKAYRLGLRVKAVSPFYDGFKHGNRSWPLGEFVEDVFPEARTSVLLIGTPGPAQKLTVQLWGDQGILGYVKYAEKPAAQARLANEYAMLRALPPGAGPIALKHEPFWNGVALLLRPVAGRKLPVTLPPSPGITPLLANLHQEAAFEASEHPWLNALSPSLPSKLERQIEVLSDRAWPSVYLHGDFTPWNIVRTSHEKACAIDWEYGCLHGFPYIDYCYYILQVGFLIYKWSPWRTREQCTRHLLNRFPEINEQQAQALILLTAYSSFLQAQEDGASKSTPLQAWRHALWKGKE